MLRKQHPAFREGIYVRCFDLLLTICTYVAISQVIGEYINDVGFPEGFRLTNASLPKKIRTLAIDILTNVLGLILL